MPFPNTRKCHCTSYSLTLFFPPSSSHFSLSLFFMKKLNNFPCHLFFSFFLFYPQLKLILIIFNSLLQRFCCFSSFSCYGTYTHFAAALFLNFFFFLHFLSLIINQFNEAFFPLSLTHSLKKEAERKKSVSLNVLCSLYIFSLSLLFIAKYLFFCLNIFCDMG